MGEDKQVALVLPTDDDLRMSIEVRRNIPNCSAQVGPAKRDLDM